MAEPDTYEDRLDAGDRLVELLEDGPEIDRILAIPRGALPIAKRVADGLDLPLDVIVARKIGHPENRDLAVGAVAADGATWIHDEFVEKWEVEPDALDAAIEDERETVREKMDAYCDGELPEVEGETVMIVDDGAATGATARICLEQLHDLGAEHVGVAVPVASPIAMDVFEGVADEIVCPWVPEDFLAVWDYFEEFEQVSDEEALACLDRNVSAQ